MPKIGCIGHDCDKCHALTEAFKLTQLKLSIADHHLANAPQAHSDKVRECLDDLIARYEGLKFHA